jgi:hypothetical protein
LKKKSKKVPKEMQEVYLSITKITDEFSRQYLNDEYAEFIQYAAAFIVDVRNQPKEIQEIAFEKGLIPFIPDS